MSTPYAVYASAAALQVLVRSPWFRSCAKKGCACQSTHVLVRIWNGSVSLQWQSRYCDAHVEAAAKARGTTTTADPAVIRAMQAEAALIHAEQEEQWMARARKYEADQIAETGMVLRWSGTLGRLYETAAGALLCRLADGREVTPCCWAEGARIIENRCRGRLVSGHSPGCAMG